MVTTISGFPYRVGPVNNITPFTYRDGTTYLEILHGMQEFINETLIPEFNGNIDAALEEFKAGIANSEKVVSDYITKAENTVRETFASFAEEIAQHKYDVERIIERINNRVGPHETVHLFLSADTTLNKSTDWPTNQPITVSVTQDGIGGRALTTGAGITGVFDVNPEPGSVSTYLLTPHNGGFRVSNLIDTIETLKRIFVTRDKHTIWVDDYYRIGDVDDYDAINRAILAGAETGKQVLFTPGKTYTSSKGFTYDGLSVSLGTWGKPATINIGKQNNTTGFDFQNTVPVHNSVLSESMTIDTRKWTASSLEGVRVGDLVEVKSSVSWYFDPRADGTDARKSELHRITRVEGRSFWTETPANDGYDTSVELVELTFTRPIRVSIENLKLATTHPAQAVDAPRTIGLRITGSADSVARNVDIVNFANAGLQFRLSYRPIIEAGRSSGINNYYSGYGVQLSGCTHGRVKGRHVDTSRRGIDISGANIISMYSVVEDCVIHGGGKRNDGTEWGWTDSGGTGAANSGMGSHGPADHTTYRNNITMNVHNAFTIRGGDEKIINHTHYGRSRNGVVVASYGSGLLIDGFTVTKHGFTDSLKNTSISDGGNSNANVRRATHFLDLINSYDVNGHVTIRNVTAEVEKYFIRMHAGVVPSSFFHLDNINIIFATQAGADEGVVLYHEGELTRLNSRSYVGAINFRRFGGTGELRLTRNINLGGIRGIIIQSRPETD